MDKLDYKILNILKENGRETASDISKAIHLSVSAVLDRIKKMEESGIIKGYTVRVDAKALGNDVTALMEISLEHPRFHDSFTEVIMDHPNILDCYYLTGDYDFVLKISCASSDELERIHRIHTPQQVNEAATAARKAGFTNLSLDLIYGLPGQTMDSWKATVEHALSLIPQHLSCYGLKVEEGTPLAARVAQGEVLPDDDQQADLYLWTVGRLERAGYPQYEISNFAKPGFASRHNLRYWLTQPYIGFGPGAHSDFGGRRYSFVRDLDAYIQGVLQGGDIIDESEIIPKRERCGEYLMLRLRTVQGINEQEYRSTYFMDFAPLQARLEQFRAQGWAEQTDGRWHFTPKGFLLSNQLIGDLLERQEQAHWEDLVSRPRHDHLDQGCP